MERKLCTILALDVVDFSKMMAVDEDQTLRVLNSRREFIDTSIRDHGGSIFNTAGDSVLAEFSSPVRAESVAFKFRINQWRLMQAAMKRIKCDTEWVSILVTLWFLIKIFLETR